jgi:hypothetical protein
MKIFKYTLNTYVYYIQGLISMNLITWMSHGLSDSMSGMSGHCDPEYPESHPESLDNCYSSKVYLGLESPDIYPEYPGILLPTASFL